MGEKITESESAANAYAKIDSNSLALTSEPFHYANFNIAISKIDENCIEFYQFVPLNSYFLMCLWIPCMHSLTPGIHCHNINSDHEYSTQLDKYDKWINMQRGEQSRHDSV